MKTTTARLDSTISKDEMKSLTKEVKETVAFEYCKQNKNFGAIDMWNIQRNRKSITARRTLA